MNIRRIEIHDREIAKPPRESTKSSVSRWQLPPGVTSISSGQVFWLYGKKVSTDVLFDPILQYPIESASSASLPALSPALSLAAWVIDVRWRAGVTDNRGQAAAEALSIKRVSSGDVYYFHCAHQKEPVDWREILAAWAKREIANSLVQDILIRSWGEHLEPPVWFDARPELCALSDNADVNSDLGALIESFPLNAPMEDWLRWSCENSWALDRAELQQVRDHFSKPETSKLRIESGLPESPTDVEMEIIAQTWSEHCKHKIFAADIEYSESRIARGLKALGPMKINGLFKSEIVRVTREVQARRNITWLSSTFSDNAGMVRFDEALDVSIKVETHNSPSALDPYGGALTGILGVNRDILGTGMGARPVANTDVLCFGLPDWTAKEVDECLPSGLKHPRQIMEGVHRGIQDGGNKSGIPVINGSFVFDEGYCGKPLVYCGTIGVSPARLPDGTSGSQKRVRPGHLIVMAGGRVGKDGIHGATFSSLELNEGSPQSAVQIGDPLTQKRLADFIIAARDLGLYSGITDNGAGGLSSSVGEMAQLTGGAAIEASLVPLKYPGLKPWEIIVSESQERMTIAVPESEWPAVFDLAQQHGVEVTRLGAFDESGEFRIKWHGRTVGCLDLDFLHKDLRPMSLKAVWSGPLEKSEWIRRRPKKLQGAGTPNQQKRGIAQEILGRPNVTSKESWVRRFDHEVQAATVGKPFSGIAADGPSDAGVIWLKPHGASDPYSGVAVASGINSKLAHIDTYLSAQMSLDEAVRNLICSGGDPEQTCLVDNFCWPDPLPGATNPDHAHKTAQLVRACRGLSDAAIAWGMPFVSGKDSMKNDFSGLCPDGKRVKISVPPTVLVTAMGKVHDVRRLVSSDFKQAGDEIYVVGPTQSWPLDGSEFAEAYQVTDEEPDYPEFDLVAQIDIYRKIHQAICSDLVQSCHDVSDGGLFVTIAESVIGGRIGAVVDSKLTRSRADLFHEGPGRIVVSVTPANKAAFTTLMAGASCHRIGMTKSDSVLCYLDFFEGCDGPLNFSVLELTSWWKEGL